MKMTGAEKFASDQPRTYYDPPIKEVILNLPKLHLANLHIALLCRVSDHHINLEKPKVVHARALRPRPLNFR